MKVLHLINYLGSGGAEKLLEDLIPRMNQLDDIQADVLLLTDENNVFYDSFIKKGIRVDIIKYKNMYDPRNILEIKKYICKEKYDIVHSHTFPTQYWVALSRLILRNRNVKFITTEHSTHNRRREKFYFRPIDKFVYSNYDVIISITEKTRENLINWIDPKQKNIDKHIVIENGVDIEKIKNALPYKKVDLVSGIDENTKLLCMVGRFFKEKDQPTLIKAVNKLSDDIHLILIGEGPLINENKELANQLGISERVHFLGFRQDIPEILKTVDIVVLSSHWEGFGLAAMEGMAAGKPVIASDVPGLAEVVGESGILFNKGDSMELSDKIKILFKNQKVYDEIKARCFEESKKYEVDLMVKKYCEQY